MFKNIYEALLEGTGLDTLVDQDYIKRSVREEARKLVQTHGAGMPEQGTTPPDAYLQVSIFFQPVATLPCIKIIIVTDGGTHASDYRRPLSETRHRRSNHSR